MSENARHVDLIKRLGHLYNQDTIKFLKPIGRILKSKPGASIELYNLSDKKLFQKGECKVLLKSKMNFFKFSKKNF